MRTQRRRLTSSPTELMTPLLSETCACWWDTGGGGGGGKEEEERQRSSAAAAAAAAVGRCSFDGRRRQENYKIQHCGVKVSNSAGPTSDGAVGGSRSVALRTAALIPQHGYFNACRFETQQSRGETRNGFNVFNWDCLAIWWQIRDRHERKVWIYKVLSWMCNAGPLTPHDWLETSPIISGRVHHSPLPSICWILGTELFFPVVAKTRGSFFSFQTSVQTFLCCH